MSFNLLDALKKGESVSAKEIDDLLNIPESKPKANENPHPFVALIISDNQKVCPVHRKKLDEVPLKYHSKSKRIYGLIPLYCKECNCFYVHESDAKSVFEKNLEDANVEYAIVSLQDSKTYLSSKICPEVFPEGEPILTTEEAISTQNPRCPIHRSELQLNPYKLAYLNRSVTFEAFYCDQCKNIILGIAEARDLELKCEDSDIPVPDFHKLINPKEQEQISGLKRLSPKYLIEEGKCISYQLGAKEFPYLTEDDNLVVTDIFECEQGHAVEEKPIAIEIEPRRQNDNIWVICLLGFCEQCNKYFIFDRDFNAMKIVGRPCARIINEIDKDYEITSGTEFHEEKVHLNELENELDTAINIIKNKPDYIDQYATGSYDDGVLQYKKSRSKVEYYPIIDKMNEHKAVPYTHRVDLQFGDQKETYYLAPFSLDIDGQERVISYNTDFGMEIVNIGTNTIDKDGLIYKVKLQRKFDISKTRLMGYQNLKVADDIFDQAGITDQFLQRVLRMRRRQHSLVDIIATIQKNQNRIVREKFGKSFVVQGCAGSGKTMVLLHRMSYLKYNQRDFDFHNHAVILTPNERFNAHIKNVVESLQIDDIRRYSIEQFYGMILNLYSDKLSNIKDLQPEALADANVVIYVYSNQFIDDFDASYDLNMSYHCELEKKVKELLIALKEDNQEISYQFDYQFVQQLQTKVNIAYSKIRSEKHGLKMIDESISDKQIELKDNNLETQKALSDKDEALNSLRTEIPEEIKRLQDLYVKRLNDIEIETKDLKATMEQAKIDLQITLNQSKKEAADLKILINSINDAEMIIADKLNTIDQLMNSRPASNKHADLIDWFHEFSVFDETILQNIDQFNQGFSDITQKIKLAFDTAIDLAQRKAASIAEELKNADRRISDIDFQIKETENRFMLFGKQARIERLKKRKEETAKNIKLTEQNLEKLNTLLGTRPEIHTKETIINYLVQLSAFDDGINTFVTKINDAYNNYAYIYTILMNEVKNKMIAAKSAYAEKISEYERIKTNDQAGIQSLKNNEVKMRKQYKEKLMVLDTQQENMNKDKNKVEVQLDIIKKIQITTDYMKVETNVLEIAEKIKGQSNLVDKHVNIYNNSKNVLTKCNEDNVKITNEIHILEENHEQYQKEYPFDLHEKMLEEVQKEIRKNEDDLVFNRVYGNVIDKYCAKNSIPHVKDKYRFDLYARLLFCLRFYDHRTIDYSFVCIDEAQDNSLNEYRLLKQLCPEKTVFNLYGDIKQSLNPDKGIISWNNLIDEFNMKKFELNENYRNTNQITEYCNLAFKMNVKETGVDGIKVREIHKNDLEDALNKIVLNDDRVAIIISRCYEKNTVLRKELLSPAINAAVKESLGNGIISLMYVDEIKGIEFEKAFVLPKGMNENELYISCTRALSELVIVKTFDGYA